MRRRNRLAAALAASAAISAGGLRARALAPDGAAAATAVGTAILHRLSWRGAALLGAFFVSSSALSRLSHGQEVAHQRGSRRDAVQVLANGGVAALAVLIDDRQALILAAGALAAATADTWATEIGSTSPDTPRLIVSRRPVAAGTSGGVTTRGMAGALAGAGLLGLTTVIVGRPAPVARRAGTVVAVAGITGSLVDSVLGELVQERRWCPRCDKPTEARVHRCGEPTVLVGGCRGVTNDVVNVVCAASSAAVAALGTR